MPRQHLPPLGGLASSVGSLSSRARAQEQNRYGIVGIAPAGTYSTTSSAWQYPPGWELTVTLGYTGGAVVLATIQTVLNTDTAFVAGVSVDGASPVAFDGGPSYGSIGVYTNIGGMGFSGLPGSTHTVAIAVHSDGTNNCEFTTPTLVVWPL